MRVIDLHQGEKAHLGTLAERLMDVIEDFIEDAADKDLPITFCEVIGTLTVVTTQITMMSLSKDG